MDGTRTRRSTWMVAALVLVIGTLGVGIASGQALGDTYTGCLRPTGKLVKVRVGDDPLAPCIGPAEEVSWGEMGPRGERGSQGETGPRGPAGPTGISGYEIATFVKTQPGTIGFETNTYAAPCPAGKTVLGGGASVLADTEPDGIFDTAWDGYHIVQSYPTADGSGWNATTNVHNPTEDTYQVTVFAICVTVAG